MLPAPVRQTEQAEGEGPTLHSGQVEEERLTLQAEQVEEEGVGAGHSIPDRVAKKRVVSFSPVLQTRRPRLRAGVWNTSSVSLSGSPKINDD